MGYRSYSNDDAHKIQPEQPDHSRAPGLSVMTSGQNGMSSHSPMAYQRQISHEYGNGSSPQQSSERQNLYAQQS